MKLTLSEVRKQYLKFMESKQHLVIPSASLVPENDPTTLFTGSGMQPMLQYFLGEEHPGGVRVANSQRCFRAEDIEEIGDNRHTSYFEMLGSWSFGDYFKDEQLDWIFSYLTSPIEEGGLNLDPKRIYATVFIGDKENGLQKDTYSGGLWQKLFEAKGIEAKEVELGTEEEAGEAGMQDGRIFYYDASKNWWSRAGAPSRMPIGEPGGPNSEIFYEFADVEHDPKYGKHCHPNCDCGRFIEIGNNVFMTHKKIAENSFELLPKKNVDYGGGLERQVAAANDLSDIFKIDALWNIVMAVSAFTETPYEENNHSYRVITDHLRGSVFMIADGIIPSNTEQGYVLRRLIRRAVRHADVLGVPEGNLSVIAESVIEVHGDDFPKLRELEKEIISIIAKEEAAFRETLAKGMREFEKGERDPFKLFTTYGFPIEMTHELAEERGEKLDESNFAEQMKSHQETSREGSKGKFKGGLGDHSEMSVKYHTGTHLLQQALRTVLGDHVLQKGSNITPERLRFDFSHSAKMTDDEKKAVEDLVNEQIYKALPVSYEDIPLEEAEKRGAIGLFEEKYGDKVRVYQIGQGDSKFSLEFCGGPHVSNTSELGENGARFKIKKEEAVAAGIRRIKAVLL